MDCLKNKRLFLLDMDGTIYLDTQLFDKSQTVIFGDRLYTDIASGYNAGVTTVFVLSGEGTMEDVEKSDIKPDYIYKDIKAFYEDMTR